MIMNSRPWSWVDLQLMPGCAALCTLGPGMFPRYSRGTKKTRADDAFGFTLTMASGTTRMYRTYAQC